MMAQVISAYLVLHLLLSLGAALAGLARRIGRFQHQLRLNYSLLCLTAAAFVLQFLLPRSQVFHPWVRMWAAPTRKGFDQLVRNQTIQFSSPSPLHMALPSTLDYVFLFVTGIVFGALLVAMAFCIRDAWRLWRQRRQSFKLRTLGRVQISVNERTVSAFSYATPWRAYVVLPIELLARPAELRLTLQHELQHHRQGDTGWVYVLFALRALCFCNPLVHLWMEWISEVQEFACDEAMVDRKHADPQVYARCLAEAAQTALLARYEPVCATGFLFASRRNLLARRIATMFKTEKTEIINHRWTTAVLVTATLALSATAYAAKDWIQDKRISLTQAENMARVAQAGSKFPIVVNEDVLRELNRYLGTPEGRDYIKKSLHRMQNYSSLIQAKIHTYGLPEELMAVPLVESGFKNESVSSQHGAGLWQFIVSTARRYDLIVNSEEDQRFNEPLATDAALRYLIANHQKFKNWPLAIMAYNAGEANVQQGMSETGTDDAWSLIKAGFENDRGYLARVMAAVLILKNPRSVE